ncbi:hypothetical protein Lupro_09835 [Lutibacter profundi]|uniref:Uncharacterized protein n=1 Tax=Lutibacter profundi TaxID=1622118 RepID=A0A0X8G7K9_9FLAO|nr:hypothetical protein [Lutibacter profundi]AMC11548.1 hypothetical protein Lupro_09835 [Lutibacter profundi]
MTRILIFMFLLSLSSYGQEIGSVKSKNHSIKLLKSNNQFLLVYSDLNSESFNNKSFHFPNKNTIYNIIVDGFDAVNDHQVIVKTNNDTIIKFEFKRIKGKKMLKIKQNNLISKTFSASAFFTKNEILNIFREKT